MVLSKYLRVGALVESFDKGSGQDNIDCHDLKILVCYWFSCHYLSSSSGLRWSQHSALKTLLFGQSLYGFPIIFTILIQEVKWDIRYRRLLAITEPFIFMISFLWDKPSKSIFSSQNFIIPGFSSLVALANKLKRSCIQVEQGLW